VLLGNRDKSFKSAVSYGSGGYAASSVAVADVNGDGKPDLLVTNQCASEPGIDCTNGSVGVLLGKGDGTFEPAVTYSSGGYVAFSVAVADVNGDGKPDLVVANLGSLNYPYYGTVAVLLGKGDGTFEPAVAYDSGGLDAMSVAIADVNRDGKPDIIVGNSYCIESSSCGNGTVGVLLGNGDGTFQTAVTYGTGGYTAGWITVAVADVNGDGDPDVLATNICASDSDCKNGTVGVLLGKCDGTFEPAVTYSSGGLIPQSVAVADVNRDGKPDLVVANCSSVTVAGSGCIGAPGSVGILLGKGDGTFERPVTYSSGGSDAISVAVVDHHRNCRPDIVVANYVSGTVGVLLNDTRRLRRDWNSPDSDQLTVPYDQDSDHDCDRDHECDCDREHDQ
jgi:hypothetical protein